MGLWQLFKALLILWAALAIYYSNLPWPPLRLGLAIAFAAFAIWGLWISRQRRMPAAVALLFVGVVGWWITITPKGERNWRPEVALKPRSRNRRAAVSIMVSFRVLFFRCRIFAIQSRVD